MDLGFTETQELLKNAARDFLETECPEQLVRDMCEQRLILQIFAADAVNALRALVDIALGIQEAVELPPGQASIHHLDATDFDYPVALGRGQSGGFGV